MTEHDPEFVRRMEQEPEVMARVAAALRRRYGWDVRIKESRLAPNRDVERAYRDDGDMENVRLLQMKYRGSLEFHSAEEFPFADVIVDEVYKADKHYTSPLEGYVVVNQDETGCLLIPISTRPHWTKRMQFDGGKTRPEDQWAECYFCPKEKTKYIEL